MSKASANTKILVIAILLVGNLLVPAFSQEVFQRAPGENWQRYRRVEDAGFSPDELLNAINEANLGDVAGLVVVHDGAMVLRYGDIETRYMCHSVRKSLMSILFGMYDIDLSKTLEELGIDDSPTLTDDEKQATIGDLLKSRSGIYHQAAYEPNSMKQSRPSRGSHKPGTHWWYNNWDFNTLLTIFEKETGEKFFEAFQQRIAEPLQLQDFRLRDGYYHRENTSQHPAYPFRMSARDMARIGWLIAAGGKWADRQIVPGEWVHESTQPHSIIDRWNGYHAYGYLWWIGNHAGETVISALGNGNNSIDIVPDRKLVFVFRANTFKNKNIRAEDRRQIIESIINAQNQPPNQQPELTDVVTPNQLAPGIKPIQLDEIELQSFPVDLPRQLPDSLPTRIRDQKIRIDVVANNDLSNESGPGITLFPQPPSALQLDLIPLGEDRYWIEGLNETGIIARNDQDQPITFLMKDDLIASALEAGNRNDKAGFERLTKSLKKYFDYVMVDRDEEIAVGIQKLVSLQEAGQKWPYEGNYRVRGEIPLTYELGGTALVCLALLYGADEDAQDATRALENGLSFVLENIGDARMATSQRLEYDMRVLAQAYSLLLLSHVRNQRPNHQKRKLIDAGIRQLTESLVAEQMADGGWNYQGRPVHASFVTASVVQALAWANHKENPVSRVIFERASRALVSSRYPDGGIRYFGTLESHTKREPQDLLPGSIGRAPICESMLYLLGSGSVSRIQKSIDAFHRHWLELERQRQQAGTHDGPFLIAPYYFYYGHRYVAQAIELLPESRRPAERDRLYQLLMKTKAADGTWNDRVFPRARSYCTAMVVLALLSDKIGTPPRLPARVSSNQTEASERPDKYRDQAKVMVKNVYVRLPDRTIRNVTPTPGEGFYGAGCIHPDGKDIVFPGAARGYSRIWKYRIPTGTISALTPDTCASINPSYSSDGQQIVFVSDRDLDNPRFDMFEVGRTKPHDFGFRGGISSGSNLYIMNADGSGTRRLTSGNHYDTRPSFSPDGKTIVFLSSRGAKTLHVWTVPADGSSEPVKLELNENPWAGRPRYSMDGKDIFFFTGITDGKYSPQGRHTLCTAPATGGAWRIISGDTIGKASHGPDPGPDGNRLWYHALVDDLWGIYHLELSGGKPTRWIPEGFERSHIAHPAVSRNGYISFDSRSFIEATTDK